MLIRCVTDCREGIQRYITPTRIVQTSPVATMTPQGRGEREGVCMRKSKGVALEEGLHERVGQKDGLMKIQQGKSVNEFWMIFYYSKKFQ